MKVKLVLFFMMTFVAVWIALRASEGHGPLPAGVVVASLDHSWTVLRSCQWCLSAGGPYEGGVLYFSRSAGFLCAVFDGQ